MSSNQSPEHVTAAAVHLFSGTIGFRDWIKRLDLYRYIEYPVVYNYLQSGSQSILDVGSATSVFPLFLASRGHRVLSIDISERTVQRQRTLLASLEDHTFPAGLLRVERQDVCALPYPDATFEAVTAISTIEHIPDTGDSIAIREMARVLKPEGRLILTFPFTTGDFYPGTPPYSSALSQRVYNDQAMWARLIVPSGLKVYTRVYFLNKRFDFERKIWRRLPQQLINGIGWTGLALLCSRVFFRVASSPENHGANAACVVLEK